MVPSDHGGTDDPDMNKRVVITVLWFFAGWGIGAGLADLLALNDLVGPLVGIAIAALIGADPMHVLWPRQTSPTGLTAATRREPI